MIDDDAGTLPDEDEDSAVAEASPPMTREATSAAKPRTARKRRAKATKPAGKAKKGKKAGKAARAAEKAAQKKSERAKKAKKAKTGASKKAGTATMPSGFARVKMGGQVFWVGRAVARALTAKDRKRLKAVLKRAEKRAKSAK